MTNSMTRSSLVAGLTVALTVALSSCGDPSPSECVLESLGEHNPARSTCAAAIDDYASRTCAAVRALPNSTLNMSSRFIASAPPGALPGATVQGLTTAQRIELDRSVATEYCPDVLRQGASVQG